MQIEFPFTRNGALYLYNIEQEKHINKLYMQHFRETKNPHYIRTKQQFIFEYINNGGAKKFAEENSDKYFENVVEKQTPQAKYLFESRTLIDRL